MSFSWESLGAKAWQQQTWLANLQWFSKFCLIIFTHFTLSKKKMTCPCMSSMATLIARRSLNRCHGYFEQTVPFYIPLMNFKATSVRKEDSGHERHLPVGNPFGRPVISLRTQICFRLSLVSTENNAIGARKQVSIFLWCIANEEKTQLIADRFNVTCSSVSRVVRLVTESVLA